MTESIKRFRMLIDLRRARLPVVRLPEGYRWVSWRTMLVDRHAQVKWQAFRNDLDGQVFPCLNSVDGCRRLMKDITSQPTFCANATWMLVFQPEADWPAEDCASIQGVSKSGSIGAIQNVGVIPEHRGLGLGRALVLQSLHGFRHSGLATGFLEVTARNRPAVSLYKSIGFEIAQVLYRDVESSNSSLALMANGEPSDMATDEGELSANTASPRRIFFGGTRRFGQR